MAIEWDHIQSRHDLLAQELASPALDPSKRSSMQKEISFLTSLLSKRDALQEAQDAAAQTEQALAAESDEEMQQLFAQELDGLQANVRLLQSEINDLLFPPDPLNNRSVFLEIRAGAGGQEAALFAADLMRMYTNYALARHWRVAVASVSETDLKGVREVILHIQGKGVYGRLKYESGVHRVQRVPTTEASGRIHTSTATIAVLPEAKEVDVAIDPGDLRIDVFRASGAGGQHVNTTDSAVRITHIPTGVVVSCQDERSQYKNKNKALKMLQSRLLVAQQKKQEAERSKQRKEQVGTGMRAEKVRTYNFPQNRVTDHQANVTLKTLDTFIGGNMDGILDPLMQKERESRRSKPRSVRA